MSDSEFFDQPAIQYLRGGSGFYSALLAVFENQKTACAFTICQILYLTPNNEVKVLGSVHF